jgi:hypothetical protein
VVAGNREAVKAKGWDLTSLHSLEGAAEWIRKNSGALLVLVVRAEDVALAVDKEVAGGDARDMVEEVRARVKAKQLGAMR